ncbi:hypothetical protein RESH_03594 [Rhodopirellula europaea SH398]|uniref:Uncharacterized protein n=1 Tax=Rhodopirellula europaea SH398 TaxID=1263868 RepID=M5S301_9BACT|nr:hypothetical protein RESH_03594 [Rhodopirellula europaea SH398]
MADERQLKGLLLGDRILGESGHTIANHDPTNLQLGGLHLDEQN